MASLLPNAKQQFIDANGAPLAGGSVAFYAPGTTTLKDTYQDAGATILNTNPVILDAAGMALIYGSGAYRQVVKDALGNVIWDQVTSDTASTYSSWAGTSTGSVNAQAVMAANFTSQDGQAVDFIAGFTNTGALTLLPNGLTPIPTKVDTGAGPQSTSGGEVVAGNTYHAVYDALAGVFHVSEPGFGANGFRAINGNAAIGGPVDYTHGLQISGGIPSDGDQGIVLTGDGHATWMRAVPTRDLSSIEFALHTTVATGLATATIGTNQIVWSGQGRTPSTAWVGRKLWFASSLGNGIYKVTAVSGNTITLANFYGGTPTFTSAITEVFFVAYVYGTGTCSVAGKNVTRLIGDPFLPYFADPSFSFAINGTLYTVDSNADERHCTVTVAPGNTGSATYEFWVDINNGQLTTFRLHRTEFDNENLSLYTTPEGNFIHAQYGSFGKYRPIFLATGELPYSPGSPVRQISIHPEATLLGGDYGWDAIRILTPTTQPSNYFVTQAPASGLGVSWQARGRDANVSMGFDIQGTTSEFLFTGNLFAGKMLEITQNGAGSWLGISTNASLSPAIYAQSLGSSDDVDLKISPKNAGRIWLGPYSANADAAIVGYMTVKDSSGTSRKLAIIA